MAEDDDPQRSGFERGTRRGPSLSDIANAASVALAAIAGGIAIRVQEVLALADDVGDVDIPIDSTCVESLHYNHHSGDLLVRLTDGSEWPYHRVPMVQFLRFVNARSKGGFYNAEVRGQWT